MTAETTITLKPGMAALLRGLAQRRGRTVEWTAHEAIRRWLHAETAAAHADDDKEEAHNWRVHGLREEDLP